MTGGPVNHFLFKSFRNSLSPILFVSVCQVLKYRFNHSESRGILSLGAQFRGFRSVFSFLDQYHSFFSGLSIISTTLQHPVVDRLEDMKCCIYYFKCDFPRGVIPPTMGNITQSRRRSRSMEQEQSRSSFSLYSNTLDHPASN